MRAIDRKMARDLLGMKGQAVAIALVILSGVATYVLFANTLAALYGTRDAYYRESGFADLFVSLKRAPAGLAGRMLEIPGIDRVETRVAGRGRLEIEGFDEPVSAALVSIPDAGEPSLNRLHLRQGRLPDPERHDECVLSEVAAEAHGLGPGDTVAAVIEGRRRTLVVAGVGSSPEYVYQLDPTTMFPDFKRFAVLWMRRAAMEAAFDMKGAFNDAALSLSRGASVGDAIARLDSLLAPYGGLGAYDRTDQRSHRYLSEEFRQLATITAILPPIFLGVSAFLLAIVVGRLVATQRDQIATLKAFGYGNGAVALHYLKLVALVALAGAAGGLQAGAWLGKKMSLLYMEFYRFPLLVYRMDAGVAAKAVLVSCAAATLGTLSAVRRAAALSPAEGMRPEMPTVYRTTLVERVGLGPLIAQPTRMIVRHLGRRPVHAFLSVAGIALGCAIMMLGRFAKDSIDRLVDVQLGLSQREDLTVTFVEPSSWSALHEIAALPGVLRAEPFRAVSVRLQAGNRSRRTAIQGIANGGDLQRLLDDRLVAVALPADGIVLEEYLARLLDVREGEPLTVEVLEGGRPVRQIPVAGRIWQYVGVPAFMEISALSRLMREEDAISGAWLAIDGNERGRVYRELAERPRVASVASRRDAIRNFYENMASMLLFYTFIATLLAATIAFGVVYNSARITLSERSRELASLRVLGYTRGEVSYILLGELFVLAVAALPLGFLFGRGLCFVLVSNLQSDLYRIALVLTPGTHALAAAMVLVSTAVSGLVVRHRLDHLDLVGVLKTRE